MLALIEMPAGKLLRLPDHWQEYRKGDAAQNPKAECEIGIVSHEERIE
jgi:hypothetical protein